MRKLIFAKTHKTGSTTIQNMIFRHGTQNNLFFVLPQNGAHTFSQDQSFNASDAEGYKVDEDIENLTLEKNLFAIHSVWNYKEIRKILPTGPAVTILRDPITVFESAYSYYENTPKVFLSQLHAKIILNS